MYAIELDMDHKLIPWLVPHAAWLITHFQIKADGKMPYEQLRNRPCHGKVVEFTETVHHKDLAKDTGKMDDKWDVGVWLGKSTASDEHYIGTSAGVKPMQVNVAPPGKGAVDAKDAGRHGLLLQ